MAVLGFCKVYITIKTGSVLERNTIKHEKKTDFIFLLTKAGQDCRLICHTFVCFCVFVRSSFFLVYRLKYAYECIKGKQFSYNENEKCQYILSTQFGETTDYGGNVALSGEEAISEYCVFLAKEGRTLIKWTVAGDIFICFSQSHS